MFAARSGLFWWSPVTLDLLPEHGAAEILHRHLRGLDRPFAAKIGVDAGLIVENADLNALAPTLGAPATAKRERRMTADRGLE